MKIFITWSGELSKAVALAFRDWLPLVIHGVKPFVSEEDIDKGTRGLLEISRELDSADVGLLCISRRNFNRSWVNFEAGAISREVGKSKVIPFLIDMQAHDLPRNSPLIQFQATINDRADIFRMIHSINRAVEPAVMREEVLNTLLEAVWDRLDGAIASAMANAEQLDEPQSEINSPSEMMGEVLDLVRSQNRELEEIQQELRINRSRVFVYLDELPSIPDEFMDWIPTRQRADQGFMRALTKFYHLLTRGGDVDMTPDDFRESLFQMLPLLEEAVGTNKDNEEFSKDKGLSKQDG